MLLINYFDFFFTFKRIKQQKRKQIHWLAEKNSFSRFKYQRRGSATFLENGSSLQ